MLPTTFASPALKKANRASMMTFVTVHHIQNITADG